jgi:type IV secretory pathway TraG/TraD family ATPase VirD4
VAIDEFSALGSDQVLALLARARESGISVLTATQEMADLQRAAPGFRDQVLGIVGVKIAHRQDVPESAEMIAKMAGTQWVWEETHHVRGLLNPGNGPRASRRQVERFLVHPNEVKTLPVGHAVALTKLPTSEVRRVQVAPSSAAPRGREGPER